MRPVTPGASRQGIGRIIGDEPTLKPNLPFLPIDHRTSRLPVRRWPPARIPTAGQSRARTDRGPVTMGNRGSSTPGDGSPAARSRQGPVIPLHSVRAAHSIPASSSNTGSIAPVARLVPRTDEARGVRALGYGRESGDLHAVTGQSGRTNGHDDD